MASDFTSARMELEQVLVHQFKLLQDMIALTKRERTSLMNDPDAVLAVVEDKEALLDSMTLLEDQCRKIVQEISLSLKLHSQETSIQALLPYLDPDDARRVEESCRRNFQSCQPGTRTQPRQPGYGSDEAGLVEGNAILFDRHFSSRCRLSKARRFCSTRCSRSGCGVSCLRSPLCRLFPPEFPSHYRLF